MKEKRLDLKKEFDPSLIKTLTYSELNELSNDLRKYLKMFRPYLFVITEFLCYL